MICNFPAQMFFLVGDLLAFVDEPHQCWWIICGKSCKIIILYCCTMGWLRLVGSLKLDVSFAEYRLLYRALLQKRPIILKDL